MGRDCGREMERVRRVREGGENKMREEMREGEREERGERWRRKEQRSMFCVIHSRTSC